MTIKFICVCSGISAPSVALNPQGFEAVCYAEIDPYAASVLAHRFGAGRPENMPDPGEPDIPKKDAAKRRSAVKMLDKLEWGTKIRNIGDFTKVRDHPELMLECDVLIGGTPCQGFSLSGLRGSLADDRSNLCLEFIRLANAIDDLRRAHGREPCIILWENVPGVLNVADGAFGHFMGGLAGSDAPLFPPNRRSWTDAGVVSGPRRVAAWRVFDAQHFGLAQRRRRVFVLATGGPRAWRVADALLPIIDSMSGHPPPSRSSGAGVARAVGASTGGASGKEQAHTFATGGGNPLTPSETAAFGGNKTSGPRDVASALSAHGGAHGGAHGRQDFETETFIVGDAPAEPIPFDTTQITSKLNRSAPKAGETDHPLSAEGHPPSIAFSIMPMNSSTDFKARLTEVAQPIMAAGPAGGAQGGDYVVSPIAFSSKDDGGVATDDLSPTLRAMGHDGSHANAGGQVAIAFSLRGRDGEVSAEVETGDVSPALRTGGGGSDKPFVATAFAISFQERGRDGGVNLEAIADQAYALTAPKGGGRAQERLIAYDTGAEAFAFKSSHYTRDKDGAPSDIVPALSADADKGDQDPLVYVNDLAPTLPARARARAGGGLGTDADHQGAVLQQQGSAVRRLTVVECSRLQGFPLFHTLIPWPTPSKRSADDLTETIAYLKSHGMGDNEATVLANTPDGPQYRCLGNSMAVTVIEELGRRIKWVIEGEAGAGEGATPPPVPKRKVDKSKTKTVASKA